MSSIFLVKIVFATLIPVLILSIPHTALLMESFKYRHDDRLQNIKSSKGRIHWSHKELPLNGFPFTVDRNIIKQCQFGKAHKRQKKCDENDITNTHNYSKRRRFHMQKSNKVNCTAKITIRYVTIYSQTSQPNLKGKGKQRITQDIKEKLALKEDDYSKKIIYVTLPTKEAHSNHEITTNTGLSKHLCPAVKEKIYQLVSAGFTSVPVVKKTLKAFVDTEYRKDEIQPSKWDRSYYPLSKDISNHIHLALAAGQLADFDQVNIEQKIKLWQLEDEGKKFFFRPATSELETDDTGSENKFLLVHQEKWQRELLQQYGNTICLLDATYKTTKYSLPLFLLVVKTNVDYLPVAFFITENETINSIKEALSILKGWNPNWSPPYMLTDYCEAEIGAVEAVFSSTKVMICAFHREQAWERWTRDGKKK